MVGKETGEAISSVGANEVREPLGLPKGSVRAILAILVTFPIVIWVWRNQAPPDWWLALAGTVLGYYFGVRGGRDGGSRT